jgi:hypothetical protein
VISLSIKLYDGKNTSIPSGTTPATLKMACKTGQFMS